MIRRRVPPTGERALRLGRAGDTPLEARIARQEARLRRCDHVLANGPDLAPETREAWLARRAEAQIALEVMYLARARGRLGRDGLDLDGFAGRQAVRYGAVWPAIHFTWTAT